MLMTNSEKIDKFYIVLAAVLIFMAVMVIFSFKGVFGAFLAAYDFNERSVGQEVRLDNDRLDEAYKWIYNKKADDLSVRD